MCHQIISTKKSFNWLPIMACLMVVALLSCNPKSEESTTTSDTTTQQQDGPAGFAQEDCRNSFSTLSLPVDSVRKLFTEVGGQRARKLIVQALDSNNGKPLSLVAYGLRQNGVRLTGPVFFVALSNTPSTFPGYTILGDQELTVLDIRRVLSLPGGGPISDTEFRSMQFVPLRDGDRHLYYSVTVLDVVGAAGSAPTNPSPPAPPCSTCQ